MTQNNYITQSVYFHEGPFDGKVATLAIPKPFVGGMVLDVEGRKYKVTNGPTAMIVERTQATFEQGALRVAYQPTDVLDVACDIVKGLRSDVLASATENTGKNDDK